MGGVVDVHRHNPRSSGHIYLILRGRSKAFEWISTYWIFYAHPGFSVLDYRRRSVYYYHELAIGRKELSFLRLGGFFFIGPL